MSSCLKGCGTGQPLVGNMGWQHPFCFPKRPQYELKSVKPSVRSWPWMTLSTRHPSTGLSALICQVNVYIGSVIELMLKNVMLPASLPSSPIQRSVGRSHKKYWLNYKMLRCIPCCSDEVGFEVNIPLQVWESQRNRCKLSDHKEVLGARLSKIHK